MITAQEAHDTARNQESIQLVNAKDHIMKQLPMIETQIKKAIAKGEYHCYVYFTRKEKKKLSIDYSTMALAMACIMNKYGYSVKWTQDTDNDLEFKISWRGLR